MTLYIAMCGFPPFLEDGDRVLPLIREAAYSFPNVLDGHPTAWAGISDEAKSLIRSLIAKVPAERLDASSLLASSWVHARGARGTGVEEAL